MSKQIEHTRTTGTKFTLRESELPETNEYNGYKVDDSIEWIDQETANTFNSPAFGYGNGPFKIIKIKILNNQGLFFIETNKGQISMSYKHFKKIDTKT